MRIINTGNSLVNSYLVDSNLGYILIDTGYPRDLSKFYKKLESESISLSEIKLIFITHVHNDHVGFLNKIMKNTTASLILHERGIGKIIKGKSNFDNSYYINYFSKAMSSILNLFIDNTYFEPVEISNNLIQVNDESTIDLMNLNINARVIPLPGHTDDSIGILFQDGSFFCGDAAMNVFFTKSRYSIIVENLNEYENSWNAILESNATMIYPGHGKPFPASDLSKYKNTHNGKLFKC